MPSQPFGFGDALITLLILAGLALIARAIRRAWGSFQGVRVELGTPTKRRSTGEVNRELWRQTKALDEARAAAKQATTTNWQKQTPPPSVQVSPALWAKWSGIPAHLDQSHRTMPEAPCECEGQQ